MSLTPEAIDKIGALTVSAAESLDLSRDAVSLPSSLQIHDLEKFHDTRRRFRGVMTTAVIAEFHDFVDQYGDPDNTICFVDQDDMEATAIIDAGDIENPLHQEFKAIISLNKTAAFTSLMSMVDARMPHSQRSFAEWIEDWNAHIKAIDQAGAEYPLSNAVQAIRSMTIEQYKKSDHKQENFKAERGTLESIAAKSEHTIPAMLDFKCVPFHGLEERTIRLRVNVILKHDEISISLGYPLELHDREVMAEEFKEKLKDGLTDTKVFIGSFS